MDDFKFVKRTGIVFRPGSYEGKGTFTLADVEKMIGNNPLPINLEHRPSLLSGKLGQLTRRYIGLDDTGQKVLFGEWEEPEPLALLLGETARRCSIEIDLKTKQPVGLALTHTPYITDACLFSTFAKFSRGETIESIGDVAEFVDAEMKRDFPGPMKPEAEELTDQGGKVSDQIAPSRRVFEDQLRKRGI